MATQQELEASAGKHARSASWTWDKYLLEIYNNPDYNYKNTEWYKAGADLQKTKSATPTPPNPTPTPPPKLSLALVQNVLILADDPWPALDSPHKYNIWVTADFGYRHLYDDGTFIKAAKDQGRQVWSWCDCKAVLGEGTEPAVAIEMARAFGLDGAAGEGEHALAFQSGIDAGMKVFVVNMSALTEAQLPLLDGNRAVATAELYLNKEPNHVVDWKNCAGVGSNCGATYDSPAEPAHAVPISGYEHYPNAVYPTMSWYCGGSPKPAFSQLP